MRFHLAAVLLMMCVESALGQQNVINIQDMAAPIHIVYFSPSVGATLKPGALVDMSRPHFISRGTLLDGKPGPVVPISQANVSVVSGASESSSYRRLAASVEAALNFFISVEGKLGIQDEEVNTARKNTIYARLSLIDGVQALDGRPTWPASEPVASGGADDTTRLTGFVTRYGTHFVHKLYYGRTIAIKATMLETNQQRRNELEASLSTNLLGFSLDASYVQAMRTKLAGYQFTLLVAFQGGRSDRAERTLIRSLEELDRFVTDLKVGTFQVESAPIGAELLSLAGYTGDNAIDRGLQGGIPLTIDARQELLQRMGEISARYDKLLESSKVKVAVRDYFLIGVSPDQHLKPTGHGNFVTGPMLPRDSRALHGWS